MAGVAVGPASILARASASNEADMTVRIPAVPQVVPPTWTAVDEAPVENTASIGAVLRSELPTPVQDVPAVEQAGPVQEEDISTEVRAPAEEARAADDAPLDKSVVEDALASATTTDNGDPGREPVGRSAPVPSVEHVDRALGR